ncbi:hypothetical protein ACFUTU_08825 [Arthrobacter sp. NPDC057388]|uniref:hypothetical protein n=1 Tax=Arthrobacter sp. NPDC057388 TaxID=3346116 RepID=UPI003626218B
MPERQGLSVGIRMKLLTDKTKRFVYSRGSLYGGWRGAGKGPENFRVTLDTFPALALM